MSINTNSDSGEIVVTGQGVAPGIAIGPVYVYSRTQLHVEEESIAPGNVEKELKRLRHALKQSGRDLEKIISITREKMGNHSADIFRAQSLMLEDVSMLDEVRHLIRDRHLKADYAVRFVMDEHRRRIEASEDQYLRERSHDLADVEERVIRHLQREKFLSAIDPDRIVIAENLTAADIVLFSRRKILGCAMDLGGATSHVSIMARSLGLPAVILTHGISEAAEPGMLAVVDGFRGQVILDPTDETLRLYRVRRERYDQLVQESRQLVDLPAETIDHRRIILRANLEFKSELGLLKEHGAQGVGLFRTELLFLMEGRIDIGEEQQFDIYRIINESVGDEPTTIRILDLGGDKMLPMAHREHNPFLGWRGIRVLLDRPEILRTHLRAILRASDFGPLRILVPMVSTLEEIRKVKQIIREEMVVLTERDQAFDRDIQIGAMIEVPSAALMADQFAMEVDFLSIGTNDLTQYVLAVDRGNDLVADLYQELHPAMLNLIKQVADAGKRHDVPVSICGEMASDTRVVPLLVGLGINELSVAPVYVPHVKRIIRAIEFGEVSDLADRALGAADAAEVAYVLDDWLASHPYDLLHFIEAEVSTNPVE